MKKFCFFFETKIKKTSEIMFVLEKENETLKQIRDTLLPKLILGEIELPIKEEV